MNGHQDGYEPEINETKLEIRGNFGNLSLLCVVSVDDMIMLFPMPLNKKQALPVFAWRAAMAMH